MARSNIYVTFGYVVLILTILAGIAVGIYYLVKYFTSQTVTIDNVQLEPPTGGLELGYLKFSIKLNGPCVGNCTPVLTKAVISGTIPEYIPDPFSFHSLVSTGTNSWDASIVITGPSFNYKSSLGANLGVKVGSFNGYYNGPINH